MSKSSNIDVQETVDNLKERVAILQRQARSRMRQSVDTTKQAVQDYPAIALGVAFAAGLLMGVLLGWKGKERTIPTPVVEVE
jgi:ElaB/YqjD/DUF883 family membrane-anchored ribosome-binding protein